MTRTCWPDVWRLASLSIRLIYGWMRWQVGPDGDSAWALCNRLGVGISELQRLNKGLRLTTAAEGGDARLTPGQKIRVPHTVITLPRAPSGPSSLASEGPSAAQRALIHASASGSTPKDGLVAVKVSAGAVQSHVLGLDGVSCGHFIYGSSAPDGDI